MTIQEKVNSWLESDVVDSKTKTEIREMSQDILNDSFYTELEFGTGGLRGVMGAGTNRMNRYTVGMATQGLANYLKNQFPNKDISVAIAHDSRNNSPFFAQTTADVFSANGIKVYLFEELRPTPQLSFAIRKLGCQSGVVITASHNPKEYNGYKAYWSDGGQLIAPHDAGVIAEVRKINSFEKVNYKASEALIERVGHELDEKYLAMIESLSLSNEVDKNIRIVFSSIHGTGITLVPSILKRFGFEQVTLVDDQSEPNGNFPTVVYPNPEEKEAMTLALDKAREVDADLVLATDPDADRVGIAVKNLEGDFQLLNGNQTGALLIYYLLKKTEEKGLKGNEFIAKTIVTSDILREIADGFGVKTYETLTGFKYIAQLIREKEGGERFIGGGEESYGYLIGDEVRDKDAIASCAMLAEMVAWAKFQGKSPFEVLVDLYMEFGFYMETLSSITKKGQSGAEEIQQMMKKFRSTPPLRLGGSPVNKVLDFQNSTSLDLSSDKETQLHFPKSNVLQFLTEDGSRISVRPSGTEPKIKFYFSTKCSLVSKEKYAETFQSLEKKLDSLKQDLFQ